MSSEGRRALEGARKRVATAEAQCSAADKSYDAAKAMRTAAREEKKEAIHPHPPTLLGCGGKSRRARLPISEPQRS